MQITLYNYMFELNDDDFMTIEIMRKILPKRDALETRFSEFFKHEGSAINVARNVQQHIYRGWYELCEVVSEELINQGIFGVTANDLLQEYFRYENRLDEFVEKSIDAIADITKQYDAQKQYREIRKANRGKFIGGGFGIQGAAKGMMIAGVLNASTGAVHSVFNALGNIGSDISKHNKLKAYYEGGLCKQYLSCINKDTDRLISVLLSCYAEKTGYDICYDVENRKNAENILAQIEAGSIPREALEKAYVTVLKEWPFNSNYFIKTFYALGIDDGRLEEYALLIGHNIDFKMHMEILEDTIQKDAIFGKGYNNDNLRLKTIRDYFEEHGCEGIYPYHIQSSIATVCFDNPINNDFRFATFEIRQNNKAGLYQFAEKYLRDDEIPVLIIRRGDLFSIFTTKRIITTDGEIEIVDIKDAENICINGYRIPGMRECKKMVITTVVLLQAWATAGNPNVLFACGGEKHDFSSYEDEFLLTHPNAPSVIDIKNKFYRHESWENKCSGYVFHEYQSLVSNNLVLTEEGVFHIQEEKMKNESSKNIESLKKWLKKNNVKGFFELSFLINANDVYRSLVFTSSSVVICSGKNIYAFPLEEIKSFKCETRKLIINDVELRGGFMDDDFQWASFLNSNFWVIINHLQSKSENGKFFSLKGPANKVGAEKNNANPSEPLDFNLIMHDAIETFFLTVSGDTSAMRSVINSNNRVLPINFLLTNCILQKITGNLSKEDIGNICNSFHCDKTDLRINKWNRTIEVNYVDFYINYLDSIRELNEYKLVTMRRLHFKNETSSYSDILDKVFEKRESNRVSKGEAYRVILKSIQNEDELWPFLNIYCGIPKSEAKTYNKLENNIIYLGNNRRHAINVIAACHWFGYDYIIEKASSEECFYSDITENKGSISTIVSTCAKYGAEIKQGSKFCTKCGAQVERIIVCSNCGSEIKTGKKFCTKCGTIIEEATIL